MPDRQAETAQRRDEVAKWLAANDPDPCDPIDYDASGYYRAFADALLASDWVVISPTPRLRPLRFPPASTDGGAS